MQATENKLYVINFQSALAVYIVLPICSLFILYDYFIGNDFFLKSLPENPSSLALYNLLFGLPHIIASHLLVLNKEHRRAFRFELIQGTSIVIVSIVIASYLFPLYINLTTFIVITLAHVLKQQFGLVRVFSSIGGALVDLWIWIAISIVGILASIFALKGYLEPETIKIGYFLSIIFNIVFIIIGWLLYKDVKTIKGKYFFIVNLISVPLTTCFYFSGYTFFAILTVRVIHDTTAFMIYLVHYKNKNRLQNNNYWTELKAFLTVIILSIFVAFILENYLIEVINYFGSNHLSFSFISTFTLSVIVYIEMMHYYIESKIWKKSSSCRRYVVFKV